MSTYGRNLTDSDSGIIGPGAARISVFDPMPEHGWGYTMGGRLGRYSGSSGTAAVRFSIYDGTVELKGRTASFNVSNVATGAATCTHFTADINFAPDSPQSDSVMMYSGHSYGMGYFETGAVLMHQMAVSANVSYDNESFYDKTGLGSNTPTDPYNAGSSSVEGALNVYITYEPNSPPSTPTGLSPSGFITSLTPTFNADFADPNTDHGDYLDQLDIELRAVGTSTLKWNATYNSSGSEQAAASINRGYAGTALTAGVAYEWRVRFADAFGAWGSWTSWTSFTVNSGGTVATPTAPSGKQETISPTPLSAVWTHTGGLSTNAAEVRIKSGATIVRGPFQKAVVVAPSGTISFTYAETGFAALEWGKAYTVEIRGRDSTNLWSPFSTGKAFNTNAYPSVPSGLAPASGSTGSALPLLTFTMTDADDTTATGLTAEVRIKNAAGTLLFTRTATFDAALNKWKYQTTATDFATFATYKWDARGLDGTLTSAYSVENSYIYATGPAVTAVLLNGAAANGSTSTTNTPTLTWTLTGSTQQSYRVQYYAYPFVLGDVPVYDSGTVVSATASHTVPSGFLHNATSYDIVLTVTNTAPLSGTFGAYTTTISFTPPTSIVGFSASPLAVAGDLSGQTSAILLGWTLPDDAPGTFVENIITRQISGDDSTMIVLAELTTLDQTTYIDYFPTTGEVYEYAIYKVVYQGTDLTEAAPATATASVNFDHAIVQSATNPSTFRVALRITKTTSVDHLGEQTMLFPWGEMQPTIVISPVHYHVVNATYMLYSTPSQTAESALAQLREMQMSMDVVCYRDERGKKYFGYMKYKEDYQEMRRYIITLSLTQSNFKEGVFDEGAMM